VGALAARKTKGPQRSDARAWARTGHNARAAPCTLGSKGECGADRRKHGSPSHRRAPRSHPSANRPSQQPTGPPRLALQRAQAWRCSRRRGPVPDSTPSFDRRRRTPGQRMQAWLEACTLPWSSSRLRWVLHILPRRYRTQSRRAVPANPFTRNRKGAKAAQGRATPRQATAASGRKQRHECIVHPRSPRPGQIFLRVRFASLRLCRQAPEEAA
jgi:hypothetical protein